MSECKGVSAWKPAMCQDEHKNLPIYCLNYTLAIYWLIPNVKHYYLVTNHFLPLPIQSTNELSVTLWLYHKYFLKRQLRSRLWSTLCRFPLESPRKAMVCWSLTLTATAERRAVGLSQSALLSTAARLAMGLGVWSEPQGYAFRVFCRNKENKHARFFNLPQVLIPFSVHPCIRLSNRQCWGELLYRELMGRGGSIYVLFK